MDSNDTQGYKHLFICTGIIDTIERTDPVGVSDDEIATMKALILEAYRYAQSYAGTNETLVKEFRYALDNVSIWNTFYPDLLKDLTEKVG